MSASLTGQLNPWRACRRGLALDGLAPLSQMPRLAAAVLGLRGLGESETRRADQPPPGASYRLRFERDRWGRSIVSGRVRAALRLSCQRCLGEVEIPVDAPIALALVRRDEEARDLPDELDPWLIDGDQIRPLDLVEEELLLAIPPIPRHSGECGQPQGLPPGAAPITGPDTAESNGGHRPFAVLGALRSPSKA